MLYQLHEKVETLATNQAKLNLHLLPEEKVASRPAGLPTLPLQKERAFDEAEKRLKENEDAVSATVCEISLHCFSESFFFVN